MPNSGTRSACRTKSTTIFGIELPVVDWTKEEGIADEEVRERIQKAVETRAAERAAEFRPRGHALCRKGDPAADAGP